LSWNAAAERVLGHSRGEAVGQPVTQLLPLDDPKALERVLEAGAGGERQELQLRRADGESRTLEAAVVAVAAAGHEVRAILLHDVTDERRLQTEQQAQAAELEIQAETLQEQTTQLESAEADLRAANEEL